MRQILEYMENILDGPASVLLKMVEIVPNEKIQFKPWSDSMFLAELFCHIFSVMQIHIHAVSEGQGIEEHAQRMALIFRNILTSSTSSILCHDYLEDSDKPRKVSISEC